MPFNKRPEGEIHDPTPDKTPPQFSKPKGTGKPRRTPEDRAILNQRIEQCRAMLRISMTRGEIKKSLSRAWGIKPRSVEPYISRARERNREFLDVSEDQLLADSLDIWAKKFQAAERDCKQFRDRLEWAQSEIEAADATLNSVDSIPSEEQTEEAHRRLKVASATINHFRYLYNHAFQLTLEIHRDIDRLRGIRPKTRDDDSQTPSSQPSPVDTMSTTEQYAMLRAMHEEVIARKQPPDAVTV